MLGSAPPSNSDQVRQRASGVAKYPLSNRTTSSRTASLRVRKIRSASFRHGVCEHSFPTLEPSNSRKPARSNLALASEVGPRQVPTLSLLGECLLRASKALLAARWKCQLWVR